MANILVVEDDPMIRTVYEKILLTASHTVTTAQDGEEGLKLAEEKKPDLIVLDMLMPIVDGITFLEKYDIKNKHPETKVIVMSNVMMQDKIDRAVELGAVNYKTKAMFSPKELLELVNQTLSSS